MARVFDTQGTMALAPYEERRARFTVVEGEKAHRALLFDDGLSVREVLDSFEGFSVVASAREKAQGWAVAAGALALFFVFSFSSII